MEESKNQQSLDGLISKGSPSTLPLIIQTIATLEDPLLKEGYVSAVAKKFRVSKKSISQMLQAMSNQQTDDSDVKAIVSANFEGLIDLTSDNQGNAVFLVSPPLIGGLEQHYSWSDGINDFVPPSIDKIPFLLPRAQEVLNHYSHDDKELMPDLLKYLLRFCYLRDGQAIIVASAIFASYLQDHTDIHYLPIISLVAEPAHGKSRLGKAAAYASYRGVVLNGIREAHIIRLAEDYAASIFIDLRSAWKKIAAEKCEDLILGRYEKGHQVMRVISPEKGAFADSRFFKAYGTTYIASNEPLDRILETRCIPIFMEHHPNEFENPTEQHGLEMRERLVAWRAKNLYKSLPTVDQVEGLQGRFWDISSTLLKICTMVNPDYYEMLKSELIRIGVEKVELKRSSWEGTIIQNIMNLAVSSNISNNGLVQMNVLLTNLNKMLPNGRNISSQYLGLKLKGMGIKTKHIKGHSNIVIDRVQIDQLCQQYGIKTPDVTGPVKDSNLD
ncbi:MAG: hypothetical protein AB2L12_13515 [Smithellaceae bacterium]